MIKAIELGHGKGIHDHLDGLIELNQASLKQ